MNSTGTWFAPPFGVSARDADGHGRRSGKRPVATGSSSSASTQDVVAAAQTSDGQAVPQASLPGGQCPAVVVALGFWSCPTIGDACTFASGGVTHHCACSRVDGEGQTPAWVCD